MSGLIDSGNSTDLELIRSYLKSSMPTRRCEAIRGIREHGTRYDVAELLPFLLDESPSVVRAAAKSLSFVRQLIEPRSLGNLASQAVGSQSKRSIIELLKNSDRWVALAEVIPIVACEDEQLSSLAEQAIAEWFVSRNSYLKPSANQRRHIRTQFEKCSDYIRDDFKTFLSTWLAPYNIDV